MLPLSKHDVEQMMTTFDNNPTLSLHSALCIIFNADSRSSWHEVVQLLPFDIEHQDRLISSHQASLDDLLKLLIEFRGAKFL